MLSASEREAGLESSLNGGESSLLQELPPVNAPVNGCIFGGLPQWFLFSNDRGLYLGPFFRDWVSRQFWYVSEFLVSRVPKDDKVAPVLGCTVWAAVASLSLVLFHFQLEPYYC